MSKRKNIKKTTLCEMFHETVHKYGDCRAQWWKTGADTSDSIIYSDLGIKVKHLSSGLMDMGIEKGDRLAIMSYNSPQWLWADFSILNAAALTVTIYPSLSTKEIVFIMNDSGSKILFVGDEAILEKALEAAPDIPKLEKIIIMKDTYKHDNPIVINLDNVCEKGIAKLVKEPWSYEKRWRSVELWDMATIIYTSGTTGRQKGAVHTHYSLMSANGLDYRNFAANGIELNENDVSLSFLPLAHSYERQCGQFIAVNSGSTIAYVDKPTTIVQDMMFFKPTYFMCVPRIFERVYMFISEMASATPDKKATFEEALKIGLEVTEARSDKNGFIDMTEGIDFEEGLSEELKAKYRTADEQVFSKVRMILGGRLRFAFSAAGGLPADLCKIYMAMGIRICEGYGLTETSNVITLNNLKAILPGSVGPIASGVEYIIAEDGELLVRGDNIVKEYFNNPQATAESFTEDGYFRTGDIVQKLANGYIKIVDRKKSIMVMDTGKNVPRAKIENKFSVSRYIEQVCSVGDNRKYITALIVPKFDVLINYCKANNIAYDESKLLFFGEGADRVCLAIGDDIIENEQIKALIDEEIQKANEDLENFEKIKNYTILNRKFSEEMNEITPTLKLKHREIYKNFAQQIEELYN